MNASANPSLPFWRALIRVLFARAEKRTRRPLLLGIGNPLRSDDGLGRAVAGQLALERDLDCEIQVVHQLTPELAESLVGASLIVMVDASREGVPGEIHVRQLSPILQPPGAIGAHHIVPEELATLTATIYGHCPPVIVMTITGAGFSLGEHLSLPATQALFRASAIVRQILISGLGGPGSCFPFMSGLRERSREL